MTIEQKEQFQKIAEELYEKIKPVIDAVYKIAEAIVSNAVEAWKQLKEYLIAKVSVRTKKTKKGKKYIHSYKKIELYKLFLNKTE